jgi:hypothetical protein
MPERAKTSMPQYKSVRKLIPVLASSTFVILDLLRISDFSCLWGQRQFERKPGAFPNSVALHQQCAA